MSKPKPVTFTVTAADSGAEIFLIDGSFKLVKKGIGRETFSVPSGIYKIRNRAGRTSTETIIVVREGMAPINLEPVAIDSAMPLSNSCRTHEYHMAAAIHAADAFNVSLGSGSAIVIIARQWTAKSPPATPLPEIRNPARGLALRDLAGTVLVDIEGHTSPTATFDPCVSLAIGVNPGAYRLCLTFENGRRVEQILIASPGWQTQVYLLVDTAPGEQARVDLVNGAISNIRLGERFDPQDRALRNEEIVRGALQESHHVVSDEMRGLICSADANPMFVLMGAHLLITEAAEKRAAAAAGTPLNKTSFDYDDALRKIVGNLRQALGSHPDVEAIATVAGNADQGFVFDAPPMLRASWPLLLKASIQRPEAIPTTSFTSRVAERIWGEGVWLFWLDKDLTENIDPFALWQSQVHEVLSAMSAKHKDVAQSPQPAISRSAIQSGLSRASGVVGAVGPKVRAFLARRSRTPFPDMRDLTPDEPSADVDWRGISRTLSAELRQQLVERLGVPMSTINSWLDKF